MTDFGTVINDRASIANNTKMNIKTKEPAGTFFIFATFLLLFSVGLFVAFRNPAATRDVVTMHPVITAVYDVAGTWGLLLIPAGCSLLLFAWGGYRLMDQWALFASPPGLSPDQLNQALMSALKFGPEDLAENQNGRISPRQQQQLTAMYQQTAKMTGCTTGVLLAFFMFVAAFIWFGPAGGELRRAVTAVPGLLYIFVAVAVLFLFFLINRFVQAALRARGLPGEQVQVIEGPVRLSKSSSRYGTVCTIRVGFKRFYTTEPQLNGFWHGASYRVYYVPYHPTAVFLSAEPLRQ